MLSRGRTFAGVFGNVKAVCGVKRARPSSQLSQPSFSRALPIAIPARSEHWRHLSPRAG